MNIMDSPSENDVFAVILDLVILEAKRRGSIQFYFALDVLCSMNSYFAL